MKYEAWLSEWLAVCVKPTAKERTYIKYAVICRKHLVPALGSFSLEDLSAPVLQRFIADMVPRFSPNTANVIVSVLKSSLKKAVLYGATEREYTGGISRPRSEGTHVQCFTREEQRRMETYILSSGRPRLMGVVVSLYTGVRIGELLALTWDDLDFESGILSVTKSCHDMWDKEGYRRVVETPKTESSVRRIPVPKPLLDLLGRAKREGGTYIVGGDSPMSVRAYQRSFEALLHRLRIPHRGFHALRHTFATRALECGIDVKTLSEILGHKNPSVTLSRYVHSLMEHKHMMMNKLGKLLL